MKNTTIKNKLSTLCLALPEAGQQARGDHAKFTVRGKVFARLAAPRTLLRKLDSGAAA